MSDNTGRARVGEYDYRPALADAERARARLRDEFAMAAMQGFCANPNRYQIAHSDTREAFDYADAMLAARAQERTT